MSLAYFVSTLVVWSAQSLWAWEEQLPGAAISAVILGLVIGPFLARLNRSVLAAMGPIPKERHASAKRGAVRGPVPADEPTRQAALRLAEQHLARLARYRIFNVVVFGLMVLLTGWLALADSPWWWAGVAFYLGFLGAQFWLPGHLRRRIALLTAADPQTRLAAGNSYA